MKTSNSIIVQSQKNDELDESKNLQYFNLYPSVSSFYDITSTVPFIKWEFNQQPKTFQEELYEPINKDVYDMNEEFLESLLQRKSYFDKNKTINTICDFIRNSKLIKKLESETSDKKMDSEMLILNCAKSLGYVKLEKGEVLFKIGDIGDKFFFILSGKINILKLKELKKIYMTNVEYLQYCIFLINNKEDYILNEVFKKNKKVLDITNIEDIIKLYRIVFIKILRDKIINHEITTNGDLLNFFKEYKQDPLSFHIYESDLKNLQEQIQKGVFGSARDWENYILKRVRMTIKESIFFEDYEDMFKERNRNIKYNIICYVYESFLFLGPGLFFGDFALDSENARRNATIRAEEKTYLAWMKSLDYANIIAPKRKIEKHNEIMFLYKNYFFRNINVFTFEKKYFHLFPPREFTKGEIMFQQSDIPKGIYFIKTGQIQLEIKVSLFELEYVIEQVFERMVRNKFYKLVSKYKGLNYLADVDRLKNLRKNLRDANLLKMKDKGKKLLEELNKRIKYKITIITSNELIAIEEIFLGIGYLCSGEVISDKVMCYELSEKQLNSFLEEEKNLIMLYTKNAVSKIIALLDRLMNLRKNRIYLTKSKYENIHIEPEIKINEDEKNKEENNKTEEKEINKDNKEIIENEEEINLIDLEQLANQRKKEFGNKYPLTSEAKLNIKKILQGRFNDKSHIKKDRYVFSLMKNRKKKTEIQNQKKIVIKHFSFFNDLNEDKKKNSLNNSINNEQIKQIIPEKINKKDNSLLIGNTYIEIEKLKKEIKEFNFYISNKNNFNYKSKLNSDEHSQIFELSQLRYPLSDRLEQNNNIITSYNYNSMTIYNKNQENAKNELKETEKNYFIKRINNSRSQKLFYEKIKNTNKGINNTISTKTLSLSENKINEVNLSREQFFNKIKKKIIKKKELLPGIIKEFDKKMRKQMLYSYINKRNTKKELYENKKDKEYNFHNISSILPKISKSKY